MSFRTKNISPYVCFTAAFFVAGLQANAQTEPIPPPKTPGNAVTNQASTIGYVRVKASPDECFSGLGLNVKFDFINQANPVQPCGIGKKPRVNQSYIWGIVPDGNTIWFGTTSNGHCITHGGLVSDPTTLTPYQTDSWACEFWKSPYSPSPLPGQVGDLRPPRFYTYDRTLKTVRDITPKAPYTSTNLLGLDPLWQQLRGARASIIIGGRYLVIGGPALSADGRLNFFVWDKTLNKWIVKVQLLGYDNIRRWVEVNGVAYAGVGKSLDGNNTGVGGAVVRLVTNFATIPPYVNGVIPVCTACLSLQQVGNLDGEGAYLAVHNNRIYITTWPKPGNSGLFMGPVIPAGGYTTANQTQWVKVWKAEDYEPDSVLASSYAGGAIASWNGYLWWGTMNPPWSGPGRYQQVYGKPPTKPEGQVVAAKAWRSTALFRAQNLDTATPDIQLLYGEKQFYKYTPPAGATPGVWNLVDNVGSQVPLFGTSGFDNTFNNYIWSMAVWNNKLYVGTMDWSYMAGKGAQVVQGAANPLTPFIPIEGGYGADLWVFNNTTTKAVPETIVGYGNPTSYGIRNIVPVDSTHAFITMSNAMNLLTGSTGPNGGWELIEIMPRSSTIGGR